MIMFMAMLSGLANVMLLAMINLAAEKVSNNHSQSQLFFLYFTAFGLYIYTLRYAFYESTTAVERAVRIMRMRIADKIRRCDLIMIENMRRGEMYTRLIQDSNLISESALMIIIAGESAVVLVFSSFYLAWISPLSFLITVISLAIIVFVYLAMENKITKNLEETARQEGNFFDSLNHILEGFKEVKINQKRNDELFHHIEDISKESEQFKVNAGLYMVTTVMFSKMIFYLLLAIVVFVLPISSPTHADIVFKVTATVLFVIGALGILVGTSPVFYRTNMAVANLYNLEKQLDVALVETAFLSTEPKVEFHEIKLEDATFHYTNKEGKALFSVGPINLTVKQGKILFIVGENGSGKSTLLKLLTGLYYPVTGCISLDEEEVDHFNYHDYRELFSIIFTDFHLFDQLYGLEKVEHQKIKELLKITQLDKKTKYTNGKFTNVNLSTGQKKKLAFVVAVLEDKPIYIFDELTADQDPQFKKYFYEFLLPGLSQQGKTIIAVTHDEHYFHTADRILKMEHGNLVDYEPTII